MLPPLGTISLPSHECGQSIWYLQHSSRAPFPLNHINIIRGSPIHKKNLSKVFNGLRAPSAPKVEGQVNNMQIKLAMFEGASGWSFRQHDDEMFFVHRGRLLMKFRDREEIVEAGEFIVVPHGVEHCPVALDEKACEVLLIDSAGTSEGAAATQ
jgi:mannose-6-phosphate isomerase-like protein (cupin superfamily)